MASKKSALDSGLTVEWWPIGRPKPYKRNPRRIPQTGIDKVAKSLTEFGWQQPIVVDRKDVIIVGHTRHLAAQQLELEKVPVAVADLTAAKARAYRLADNRSGEETSWDLGLLSIELQDFRQTDLTLTLFDPDELTELGFDTDWPELEVGDGSKFQSMTFTVHDDQADVIQHALKRAPKAHDGLNENRNGNALTEICRAFLESHGQRKTAHR